MQKDTPKNDAAVQDLARPVTQSKQARSVMARPSKVARQAVMARWHPSRVERGGGAFVALPPAFLERFGLPAAKGVQIPLDAFRKLVEAHQ